MKRLVISILSCGTIAIIGANGMRTRVRTPAQLMSLTPTQVSNFLSSCATTIFTIYKETKRLKWTLLATFMPLAIAFGVTFTVTQIWRFFGG